MTITPIEYIKAQKVILTMAIQSGQSWRAVRRVIRAEIDRAWEEAWTPGNLRAQLNWQQVFGAEKPTVDQFIVGLAREMMAGREPPWLL